MARLIYTLLLYILSPLILLHFWLRGRKAPAYRKRINERLGRYNTHYKKGGLVLHCASVGEVLAATPLIKKIIAKQHYTSITITCNTPTGSEQISKLFGDSVQHCYLPLDFPGAVKRFYRAFEPATVCILETELWPNLIIYGRSKFNCKIMLLNARLSEKSQQGYRRIAPLTRLIFNHIDVLAAHDNDDAKRFIELGLAEQKAKVTGSIKFDIQLPSELQHKINEFKSQLSNYEFVWVAGSTHPLEHEQVIAAHQSLLKSHPNSLLIIVPRHPEQFDKVASYLTQQQIAFHKRSQASQLQHSILLGDTMGELLLFYGVANCAFIGGSLINRGGHNPLEAAAFSIPVISGPSYYNFMHVYPKLVRLDACAIVESSNTLCNQLLEFANNPEFASQKAKHASEFVQQSKGAIDKTIALIIED